MEISLTTDYDKQWLNCVSAIDPKCLSSIKYLTKVCGLNSLPVSKNYKGKAEFTLEILLWPNNWLMT